VKPANFKTGLLGFNRKQVLAYVDAMHADFARQMQEQTVLHQQELDALRNQWEERVHTHEHALAVQLEENAQLEQEVNVLAKSLEEKYLTLIELQKQMGELNEQLKEKENQMQELQLYRSLAEQSAENAGYKLTECKQQLLEKEEFIAKQSVEVTRLQEHVAQLEEQFSTLQADATQGAAMVDCLNLLHSRNRALSKKVADLEAKLNESNHETVVQEYTQKAVQQQQAVKSTENLFAIVRQEMQEALDSISRKIESQSIEDRFADNNLVDMSVL
jgi:chromosome segregation ATPase